MDDEHAPAQSAATKAPSTDLEQGSLNLPRLAFIGLACFSLAPVIYLNMGFMETDSGGPVMPFWALWWGRRRQLDSISLSAEV